MPTSVEIRGLVKSFGSGPPAVDDVSLTVEPGDLFFLLGPSGCGKTTLLRMVAGFTEPTSGHIAFHTPQGRRDVTRLPPNRRNTGMVFQSYALWPHMTVGANVAFGLDIRKVPRDARDARVKEALHLVQMDAYLDRKPNQLSGGQQQRVALARALVIRPDVLLLDEPLSNLDAKLRHELRSEIRRICKASGITTLYVTHDQKEALSMADRVAIMRRGKIEQLGTPADLYRRPASAFVAEFLGETNFIPGTFESSSAGQAVARTPFGPLQSVPDARRTFAPGAPILASIRPESIRLDASPTAHGTLTGTVVDSTYLGESAQITVELQAQSAPPARVKVALLNPRALPGIGRAVTLAVDPEDVVLLGPERADRGT